MAREHLQQAVQDIPSLRAVFVTTMPDCLLFDAWIRSDLDWRADEVAAYFGDLLRANRQGLKALNSWSSDIMVTIESPEHTLLLRELNADFVCTTVFERGAALGMARLHNQQLIERIRESLPSFEVERRPRGLRVVEFLQRYAPDPHAVLMRTSLRSGLPMDSLNHPQDLTEQQVAHLERTACDLLGLESLNI